MITYPYRSKPVALPPRESNRLLVKLDKVRLATCRQFPDNMGMFAFAQVAKSFQIAKPDLVNANGKTVQVFTTGIHHDWTKPVNPQAAYIVLVWPFHAPGSWQIVGYLLKEELPPNLPIPWKMFKPFSRTDDHSSNGAVGAS